MIFENPDDLGYFTDHELLKQRRDPKSALAVCNSILSMDERMSIEAAAINSFHGHKRGAESHRVRADYGGLSGNP
jgi:hypothetical protein